jgi:hypothetical protein
MLEMYLNDALDNYSLTSWNIKGGQRFTEVTLRISMVAMHEDTVKYRKVPPSRISRDKERGALHRIPVSRVDNDQLTDEPINEAESKDILQVISNVEGVQAIPVTAQHGYYMTPINTGEYSAFIQVDGHADVKCTSTIQSEIEAPMPGLDSGAPNVGVEDELVTAANVSECDVNGDDEMLLDDNNSPSLLPRSTSFACAGCKVNLSDSPADMRWTRCTDPACNNMNICTGCEKSGFHMHHLRHLMPFCKPSSHSPWCDSCGCMFSAQLYKPDAVVFTCQECDQYTICHTCKVWAGMHARHDDRLCKVPLVDFLAT